jgi:hypothetical protein
MDAWSWIKAKFAPLDNPEFQVFATSAELGFGLATPVSKACQRRRIPDRLGCPHFRLSPAPAILKLLAAFDADCPGRARDP